MKTKSLLLLTLFAILHIQCSKDEAAPESVHNEFQASFNENGYANVSNARLVVTEIDTYEADEGFIGVIDMLLGGPDTFFGGVQPTAQSDIFLDSQGDIYVRLPEGMERAYSLLCVGSQLSNDIPEWDLTYTVSGGAPGPEEISISGTGVGSHIFYLYLISEAYNETAEVQYATASIEFSFRGTLVPGTNDFEGHFTLKEVSSNPKLNLTVTGTLTLERD